MQSLSKEAEQKLITAIEKAAARVNDGMSPNDAIIKSASAANVPAGHINLMVHAYNTGRTTKQREQGENTIEKSADFQLADAQTVMDALYPKAVKTSAEIIRQQVVSSEYAVSPAGMLARRRAEQEKAAAATFALPEKTWTPPPRDERFEVERAYSQKRAAQLATEETRRQATAAYGKAASAMDELAEFFRRPGNMSFTDAVQQVGLRFGDAGVSVLNKVAEVYPQFKKQAATRLDHFGDNPVYGLVQSVLASVETYVAANEKVAAAAPAISKKEAPEFITGSIMYNPAEEPLELAAPVKAATWAGALATAGKVMHTGSQVANKSVKNVAAARDAALGPVAAVGKQMGMAGGGMMDALGLKKDTDKMRKDIFKGLTDPDHEMALKKIRAHSTLHDLMMNDSVVSGYDPHEVALAYNEVAEAAPNVVQSPVVLRAMLRKRLETGTMADFDVKQLLEMDKLKAERDNKMLDTRKIEQELI